MRADRGDRGREKGRKERKVADSIRIGEKREKRSERGREEMEGAAGREEDRELAAAVSGRVASGDGLNDHEASLQK